MKTFLICLSQTSYCKHANKAKRKCFYEHFPFSLLSCLLHAHLLADTALHFGPGRFTSMRTALSASDAHAPCLVHAAGLCT